MTEEEIELGCSKASVWTLSTMPGKALTTDNSVKLLKFGSLYIIALTLSNIIEAIALEFKIGIFNALS